MRPEETLGISQFKRLFRCTQDAHIQYHHELEACSEAEIGNSSYGEETKTPASAMDFIKAALAA